MPKERRDGADLDTKISEVAFKTGILLLYVDLQPKFQPSGWSTVVVVKENVYKAVNLIKPSVEDEMNFVLELGICTQKTPYPSCGQLVSVST